MAEVNLYLPLLGQLFAKALGCRHQAQVFEF